MSLAHIPLERLQQSDLQGLIEGQTAEARQIEYKRETYGGNDSARAEFLADVSSFANALGGDLIVGMEANAGIPTAITAFPGDADAECLRLDQIARSGIEPRIQNLEIRAIPIATGGVVIMLRIPRSYN
jgi:predicted HTH transcriptional regulator